MNQDHSYCPTFVAINAKMAREMTTVNPATVLEIPYKNTPPTGSTRSTFGSRRWPRRCRRSRRRYAVQRSMSSRGRRSGLSSASSALLRSPLPHSPARSSRGDALLRRQHGAKRGPNRRGVTGCQSTATRSRAVRGAITRQSSAVRRSIGSAQPASRASPQSVSPLTRPTRSLTTTPANWCCRPQSACIAVTPSLTTAMGKPTRSSDARSSIASAG